jgi:replication factor A1
MTIEKIIEQILSKRPEISKKEILERLEKEKKKASGFISDDTLMRMIAAEFDVEIPKAEVSTLSLLIKDLVPSLNNIAITGRVIAVFPPKTFRGNKNGRFSSLLVADRSGILRVVLWNDKANLVESGKIKAGHIVRFSHGYTREDSNGQVELHIGERGDVEISPEDAEAEDYPTVSTFSTKIGQLTQTHKNKKVNVIGVVKELFSASTFKRKDSSSGKVMRFTLADETGEIPVVAWDEKAENLDKMLKKSMKLKVVNATVKKAMSGTMELHVNTGTYVEMFEPAEEFLKIIALKEGLNNINVKGEVATKPILREVKTSDGELVKLAVFELKDETGRVWVSAWRKHADLVKDLKIGNGIMIKDAYVKKGFGEQLEISTRDKTSISF